MKKFLSKIYILLLILVLCFTLHISKPENYASFFAEKSQAKAEQPYIDLKLVRTVLPNAEKIIFPDKPQLLINICDSSSKVIGHALLTSPFADDITGYAGPTPLLVIMNEHKEIKKTILLDSSESPGFVSRIKNTGFFDTWNNVKLSKVPEHKVDTVTNATMTTSAVIKSMHKRVGLLLNQKFVERQQNILCPKNVIIFVFIILSLLSFFMPAKLNRYRVILQILSIIIIGIYSGLFISSAQVSGYILNGVKFSNIPMIALMLALTFLLPLFTNKSYYCHFVCPYGSCQELAGKIIKNKPALPKWLNNILKHSRKIFFGFIVCILFMFSGTVDLTDFEPFSVFLFSSATVTAMTLAGVFLVLSIFINRPWCRFFCPTGHFIELFRKQPQKEKRSL